MRKVITKILITLTLFTILFITSSELSTKRVSAAGDYSIQEGETLTLRWSTYKNLNSAHWISNNTNCVQISYYGNTYCTIKAIKATTSPVIVYCDYYYWEERGNFNYLIHGIEDFYVTVYKPNPTSVFLSPYAALEAGQNMTITPIVSPSNANVNYTWSSSNNAVATVSNGYVVARDVGTTYITVRTQNGLSSSCQLTVNQTPMTLLSSFPGNNTVNVDCGTTLKAFFRSSLSKGSMFSGIKLVNASDGMVVAGTVSITDNALIFTPTSKLKNATTYKYIIPDGAVINKWGIKNINISNISFTTKALEINETVPVSNTNNVPLDTPLRIVFNSKIATDSAWSDIKLKKVIDNTAVACDITIADNKLVIEPKNKLDSNTDYVLTLPANAIKNINGVSYLTSITIPFRTGFAKGTFSGGDGTSYSPYIITNQTQLNLIRDFPEGCYALGGNIQLDGEWVPIGDSSKPFKGILDGKNFKITNLTIQNNSANYIGLFGYCSGAQIINLSVSTSSTGVKAICPTGYVDTAAGILMGNGIGVTIDRCFTEGLIITTKSTPNNSSNIYKLYVGGITGNASGTITSSGSSADLVVAANSTFYAGGLVGNSYAIIDNCYYDGYLTTDTSITNSSANAYVGGLIGYSNNKIYNSYTANKKSLGLDLNYSGYYGYSGYYAGGLVGLTSSDVVNCKSSTGYVLLQGTSSSTSSTRYFFLGGLIGYTSGDVDYSSCEKTLVRTNISEVSQAYLYAGGFIGYSDRLSDINHCFNSNDVDTHIKTTGSYQNVINYSAGFISNIVGNVKNCYSSSDVTAGAFGSGSNASTYVFACGFAYKTTGTILNSYSVGVPTYTKNNNATIYVGNGFISSNAGTITSCYYDTTTSKCSDTGAAIPKTSAEMSQLLTYVNWDFSTLWQIDLTKSSYPIFHQSAKEIKTENIVIKGELSIAKDKGKQQLVAMVMPFSTTQKSVTWSVNDSSIASIDSNGVLTAKKNGIVVVRATATDGSGIYAQFSVTLTNQSVTTSDGIVALQEGNEMVIINYKGTSTSITIPDNIDGKVVTRITASAFLNSTSVKSIVIPKGITSIDAAAFKNCKNITIYCYYNSNTYSYVIKNKMAYSLLDSNLSYYIVTLATTNYIYDGTSKKPTIIVKNGNTGLLVNGTDYTVIYNNNINKGTATVTVVGKGKYNGSIIKNFVISAKDISSFAVTIATTNYTYDTKAKKPAIILKAGNKVLKNGIDYVVTFRNNINPGVAGITITGIGNYTGVIAKTFYIKPSVPKVTVTAASKSATVKWNKVSGASGYEIYMSTAKTGKYTQIYTANSSTLNYKKSALTKNKIYYFKVVAYTKSGNNKIYGSASSVVSAKVK